jgi:hypothetical protein
MMENAWQSKVACFMVAKSRKKKRKEGEGCS